LNINLAAQTGQSDKPVLAVIGVSIEDESILRLSEQINSSLISIAQSHKGYSTVSESKLIDAANSEGIDLEAASRSDLKRLCQAIGASFFVRGSIQIQDGTRVIRLELVDSTSLQTVRDTSAPYEGTISNLLTIRLHHALNQLLSE
jgi:hypothetical protein